MSGSVEYVRMATVDSGNETLFSDDSPCDLIGSPHVLSGDDSEVTECQQHMSTRPPNIQPFSGVLEKYRTFLYPSRLARREEEKPQTTQFDYSIICWILMMYGLKNTPFADPLWLRSLE
ncbi:hypothetical protein FQR65_LT05507 [Abscondita terminalis]|nr:hypothetical protein FQR65_LT05507 [Abscondita terminalis]